MKFVAVKCSHSVAMQRIIWAKLAAYSELCSADQSEIRALIADIAETAEEGRALFDILIRGKAPETVSRRTAVELRRLYEMRREYYDRAER